MVKNNNICILFIAQAIITLLLFFSEGTLKLWTMALFGILDLTIILSLFIREWTYAEFFSFTTWFVSIIFGIMFMFMYSNLTMVIGIGVMLLWILSTLIIYIPSKPVPRRLPELSRPQRPLSQDYIISDESSKSEFESSQKYDMDKLEKELEAEFLGREKKQKYSRPRSENSKVTRATVLAQSAFQDKDLEVYEITPEIKEHKEESRETAKVRAKALAYELEREAIELKRAEAYVRRKEDSHPSSESEVDISKMQNATQFMNKSQALSKQRELEKEASALEKMELELTRLRSERQQRELEKQAMELSKVETSLKSRTLTSKQNELVREANELAKLESYLNNQQKKSKSKELEKQASELKKAEKLIKQKTMANKNKELQLEARRLKVAEQDLKKIDFLNKQVQIVRQAENIAKAQKTIDAIKKSSRQTEIRARSAAEKKIYFATKTGNRFHEANCLSIKKLSKNKLVTFNTAKEAQKKGYQPCDICKP